MSNFRTVDMRLIDQLFAMESGWVLDFSNRTFSSFFLDELNIDIDDPRYESNGTSKAKRLRTFLQTVDKETAARTLKALWEYRSSLPNLAGDVPNAEGRFLELVGRLEGRSTAQTTGVRPQPAIDRAKWQQLKNDLVALQSLPPQGRGYAFERFLTGLFNAHGMAAREPFSLRGEQVDGSFQLGSETYLVEAKWQAAQTGAADLHVFHGKIEQKAAWTRGLFISNSGFTEDGLTAFGRGERVICMDGYDLWEALDRELPLTHVLERKIRRAAETGATFTRVRDLFV